MSVANTFDNRLDRLRGVFDRLEVEVRGVGQRAESALGETRARIEKARGDLRERADGLRRDGSTQLTDAVERVVAALPLASRRDVERLEKKVSTLQRKLKKLEKERPAASA